MVCHNPSTSSPSQHFTMNSAFSIFASRFDCHFYHGPLTGLKSGLHREVHPIWIRCFKLEARAIADFRLRQVALRRP